MLVCSLVGPDESDEMNQMKKTDEMNRLKNRMK